MISDIIDILDGIVTVSNGINDFFNLIDFLRSIFADKTKKSVYKIARSGTSPDGIRFKCSLILTVGRYGKIRLLRIRDGKTIDNTVLTFPGSIVDGKFTELLRTLSTGHSVTFSVQDLSGKKYLQARKESGTHRIPDNK